MELSVSQFQLDPVEMLHGIGTVVNMAADGKVGIRFVDPQANVAPIAEISHEYLRDVQSTSFAFGREFFANAIELQSSLREWSDLFVVKMIRFCFVALLARDPLHAISPELLSVLFCEGFSFSFGSRPIPDIPPSDTNLENAPGGVAYIAPSNSFAHLRVFSQAIAARVDFFVPALMRFMEAGIAVMATTPPADLSEIPPQCEIRAVPVRGPISRTIFLPPGSSGCIPVSATQMPSAGLYEIDGRRVSSTILNGRMISLQVNRSASMLARPLKLFVIPRFLSESDFTSPLGSLHLMFLAIPLLTARRETFQALSPTERQAFMSAVTVNHSADLYRNIILDCFLELADSLDDVEIALQVNPVLDAQIATFKGGRSTIQDRILASAIGLRSKLLGIHRPISDNKESLIRFFDFSLKWPQSNVSPVLKGLACACALIRDPELFPLDLLAYLWVTCDPPLSAEAFAAGYAEFDSSVAYLLNEWRSDFDVDLRTVVTPSPDGSVPLLDIARGRSLLVEHRISDRLVDARMRTLSMFLQHYRAVESIGGAYGRGILHRCPRLVDFDKMVKKIETLVFKSMSRSKRMVTFNRFQAMRYNSSHWGQFDDSLLGQLMRQIPLEYLPMLKCRDCPWTVNFVGEGAIDMGGPGRAAFTDICRDLMMPKTGLFVPTPNARNGEGSQRDLLMPNPEPFTATSTRRNAFYYAGALIALAYITSNTHPFKFVPFVWRFLTGRDVTLSDIGAMDADFFRIINSDSLKVAEISPQVFAKFFPSTLQVQNSLGVMVDLVPNGGQIPITPSLYRDYVRRCKEFRLKEFLPALSVIAEGFWLLFPKEAARIPYGAQLAAFVCGSELCPVEELMKHCRVIGVQDRAPMFWRVMRSFTPEERISFIGFASGRGGLPPPGMHWESQIEIEFLSPNPDNNPRPGGLPTAATCFSAIKMPHYETEEDMAAKIRIALKWGGVISDGRMDLGDIDRN
jgi:hypothetical protein